MALVSADTLWFLVGQLVGSAFLGLGLWLRFSNSTRGIFQIEGLNSSAFVLGECRLLPSFLPPSGAVIVSDEPPSLLPQG